jgi:hypothetical protein
MCRDITSTSSRKIAQKVVMYWNAAPRTLRVGLQMLCEYDVRLPDRGIVSKPTSATIRLPNLQRSNKSSRKDQPDELRNWKLRMVPRVLVETREAQRAMTGADVVVETLEARGTKHVFGVSGAKIDKVYDRLLDSSIQTVVCRHEQNAAFIAGGIGRLTGKAGVALVTSGPGVSNLVTGLATANSEGDPIVALGGAVAVADRLKSLTSDFGFGGLVQAGHEVFRGDRFSRGYRGSAFGGISRG